MTINGLVSVVIPARNEPYLRDTILDLLKNCTGEIEIFAILDGYWPPMSEVVKDRRVHYVHFSEAKGMRNGINSGVSMSRGEFILKCDAHCMFAPGWDTTLKANCKDNWIVVPRRFPLDVEKWQIEERGDTKYPVDYMYLSSDLHGEPWNERRDDSAYKNVMIDDLMSAQGSCWFMKRDYYSELELLDEENYGTFYNEFQEIGLKCWLSGGEIKVNKNTWYAHWHKPKDVGRGYILSKGEQEKAQSEVAKWNSEQKFWHKQIHPLSWLVNKFRPVPTW